MRIRSVPVEDEVVQRMDAAVQEEYVRRYGSRDVELAAGAEFRAPHGGFLVAFDDDAEGAAVATAGWHGLDEPGTAEMKRLYVVPAARRRGIATLMLQAVERCAGATGVSRMVLATSAAQTEAIALYRSQGYRPVDPFADYAYLPATIWLGRSLRAERPPASVGSIVR